MLKTPILLIIFNRPDSTSKVFNVIRDQKPKNLFVAADGPRPGIESDIEKCKKTREVINVDWNCNLHTFFQERNLGCGKGPVEAISWFFRKVEEGIIIEDDCIPHPDFFPYCNELLERFRNDQRIFFIGGTNFQKGNISGDGSYYFSSGSQGTWGWATWKRSWNNFDYYLNGINEVSFKKEIKSLFFNFRQREYWMEIFKKVKQDRLNESCWDYQFYFSNWKEGKLAISPNCNLVTNIGFENDATHTVGEKNPMMNIPTNSILPLKHVNNIIQDKKADYFLHKNYIQPHEYGWSGFLRLPYRINKRIKSFLKIKRSWF
jgi:hypothetical protein